MLGPLPAATAAPDTTRDASPAAKAAWGDDGFTFGDLVDIVNPLQHVPVLSWAYRALSGDTIAPAAKILGGTLFGGAVGFALSVADATLQGIAGRDAGEAAVAMFSGRERDIPAQSLGGTLLARAETPAAPAADRGLTEQQFARLTNTLGAVPVAPQMPAWQRAAANMPEDQVAILLRSVGLPPRAGAATGQPMPATEAPVAIAPAGSVVTASFAAMPALPVSAVAVTELAPPAAARRDERLVEAAAAGEELRRLFATPR